MGGPKFLSFQRKRIYPPILVFSLCLLSYLFGAWQHSSVSVLRVATSLTAIPNRIVTTPIPCDVATATIPTKPLDFSTHHLADDGGADAASASDAKLFAPCNESYSEYTPCEDPKRSWKFNRRQLVYRERHCPKKYELLKCLVPAPFGYRNPLAWPASRDYVWYANVPHKHLTVEKAVQNWIIYEGDKFRFPGGGTMFPNGADAYINSIGRLINLNDGSIRTAIDTGCGVASLGAYLLSRQVLTMSVAPRDTHEAQVQFALERGVPAMIGILASMRLPYPSRAFDMAHCSRCLIPWAEFEGLYLIEIDRILRPGGYWVLSGPPIMWKRHWRGWGRTQQDLKVEQSKIENLTKNLCWKKLVEKGDIAIWQKPINHLNCKTTKRAAMSPPFCPPQDSDLAWYTKMNTCLTNLPDTPKDEQVAGGKLAKWPARLNAVPPRIVTGSLKGVTPETFTNDSLLWRRRLSHYKRVNNQLGQSGRYRNLLDMNCFLGGFAAALAGDPVWVMNVVPSHAEINTLGVVYERGFIGTYQDWCEAMSTYPRTYDLIHADSVFSLYHGRCEMEDVLLEMDRMLRPEGSVIFRDDVDVLVRIKRITDRLKWVSKIVDHENGPLEREKLLFAVKEYWTASRPDHHGKIL